MPITARTYTPERHAPQGGVGGFIQSVLGAPGTEAMLGGPLAMPGMIFQKAGVPALRQLLARQTAQVPGVARTMKYGPPLKIPSVRQRAAEATPMVRRNIEKFEEAVTGKPLTLVGFRAETRAGQVPGRGTFYAPEPAGAISGAPTAKESVRQAVRGAQRGRKARTVAKSTNVLKFRNPRVVPDGDQKTLLQELAITPEALSPSERNFVQNLLVKEEVYGKGVDEVWFARADKFLAKVLKRQGHDGIIYQGPGEIVDLAGTVTKRATKHISGGRGAK